MKRILALLLTLAMLLSFAACGNQNIESNPTTQATKPTTGATQPTTEPTKPAEPVVKKCVIFISSLGTILDAFGKSDCIVGAYGSLAESYSVPSCGKWNEVDVEAVIATGADAVFGYKNYTTEEQISTLKAAGITCYFIELSDADTAAAEVTELGRLFACQDKAKVFVDLYNQYDALLKERLATVTKLNVYVEGTSSKPKTANSTSAAHKLVVGAGLVNLYADNATQYPERNLEDVIVKNPDIIVKLLGSSGKLDDTTYADYKAGLAGVAAADNGKIILLNNECGTTAIGSIIGRLYIAKYAYPELFADVDVDAVYEKLCTEFFGKDFAGSGAFFK
jgi:iron complex transport system substrate-binding protein